MIAEFKKNGIASLTADGMRYGFIRQVGKERGKVLIIADVTEPELVESTKERIGNEKPMGIELDPERGEEI
jgi:hypothetical protein